MTSTQRSRLGAVIAAGHAVPCEIHPAGRTDDRLYTSIRRMMSGCVEPQPVTPVRDASPIQG